MTTTFDLIVVGAGPGGSNAAAVALRRGLSVGQLERYRFPRVKPCGGGVTMKSWNALRLDPLAVVRSEFAEVEINVWRRSRNRFSHPPAPLLRTVVRSQFDDHLVSQNLKASGFQFFDHERVVDIEYDGKFRVHTAKQTLVGRQLVGADGAYSIVNRVFAIGRPRGYAVAVEVTLRRDQATLPVESRRASTSGPLIAAMAGCSPRTITGTSACIPWAGARPCDSSSRPTSRPRASR